MDAGTYLWCPVVWRCATSCVSCNKLYGAWCSAVLSVPGMLWKCARCREMNLWYLVSCGAGNEIKWTCSSEICVYKLTFCDVLFIVVIVYTDQVNYSQVDAVPYGQWTDLNMWSCSARGVHASVMCESVACMLRFLSHHIVEHSSKVK